MITSKLESYFLPNQRNEFESKFIQLKIKLSKVVSKLDKASIPFIRKEVKKISVQLQQKNIRY